MRPIVATIALLFTTLAPLAAQADSPSACVLKLHRIGSVSPYRVEEHSGKATISRLRGAELWVVAEPGLTREWLQLTLTRHLAEMRGTMKDCPLDMADLRVSVESAGAGFSVRIVARDTEHAEEVLRRARQLLE